MRAYAWGMGEGRTHTHGSTHYTEGRWGEKEQAGVRFHFPQGSSTRGGRWSIYTSASSLHRATGPTLSSLGAQDSPWLFTVPRCKVSNLLPGLGWQMMQAAADSRKGRCPSSLLLLASCDRDQLLGCLGNVIGTLDDLLRQELVVHGGPRLRGHGLAALTL